MVDCKLDPDGVKRKPFSAFELFEYRVTFTIDYQIGLVIGLLLWQI